MRRCLFILLFFSAANAWSQLNLVRNPSFESFNYLPEEIGDAPGAPRNWRFATEQGSGDYYHRTASGEVYNTDENYFGSQPPHTGEAYGGFCATPRYREVLASELLQPLEKGKQYRFTMFISKGDNPEVAYLKEISVMFLSRYITLRDTITLGLPPQLIFYRDSGFTETKGWQKLTAVYTAKGYERWIYIGAHQWKCDTCSTVPGTPRKGSPGIFGHENRHAHYYVDDVSLEEIQPGGAALTPAKDTVAEETTFVAGVTYSTSNVLFKSNSAVLQDTFQAALEPVISFLRAHPEMKVTVGGHTDSIGTAQDNYTLSLARAEAVKNYLADHGISADRITAKGLGETMPATSNATEEGRARNRRVEFVFSASD